MKRRILVIDDDPNITRLLKLSLGVRGDAVEIASNGKEALSMIVEHRPDIVFLDLMMPELDGFEIVEALCSAGVSRPQIYVVTAKELTAREKSYLEEHVEKIIHKGSEDLSLVLTEIVKKLE